VDRAEFLTLMVKELYKDCHYGAADRYQQELDRLLAKTKPEEVEEKKDE